MRSPQGEYQDDTSNLLSFDKLPGAIWSAEGARRGEVRATVSTSSSATHFLLLYPQLNCQSELLS